jgi:regulator of protease activity HflC (stomatin/prohibitin superfamily)
MSVDNVLQGIVALLWLGVVGLIVVAVVRASRGYKVRALSTAVLVLAVTAVVLTTISAGLIFIQPEERGVVISAVAPKGYREQPLQPGLRWIVPVLESVKTYPIYRQTYTMSITHQEGDVQGDDSILARTSDGQEVRVDASVIYAVDPEQVIVVHIDWQDRYPRDLVRPLSRGVIRDVIAQYGVQEVYSTNRNEMTVQINQIMNEKMRENGLMLVDFVLRNITFSEEYAASVEQKQIAEQQAQQAFYVVEQRKQEAEQARQVAQGRADAVVIDAEGAAEARLIEADAEAKALELIAQAVAENPDLLSYLYVTKINPNVQVMLLPENVPYLLPLPTLGPPAPDELGALPTTTPTPTPTPLPEPTPTPE